MLNTLGIVDIPFPDPNASGNFAANWLERRIGGKSLLEWVVRRLTEAQQLDAVVVSTIPSNWSATRQIAPSDVAVHAGAGRDPLARLAGVVRQFPAAAIVRVQLGQPFVDPVLVDRLAVCAAAHPECDYITYCLRDGRPAILASVGLFAEWCRTQALECANREAVLATDRQHPSQFFLSRSDTYVLRLIPSPAPLDRDDVRLALEVEDDWDHAHEIFEALGPEGLDWQRIADLLDRQPAMRQRMAALNRTLAVARA